MKFFQMKFNSLKFLNQDDIIEYLYRFNKLLLYIMHGQLIQQIQQNNRLILLIQISNNYLSILNLYLIPKNIMSIFQKQSNIQFRQDPSLQQTQSYHSRLQQKRDKYLVKIRNNQKKIQFSDRRAFLLKSLKSIDLKILKDIKQSHQSLSTSQLEQYIYKLENGYDDIQFYMKINELKLEKVLLSYLKQFQDLHPKLSLIKSLNQLLYYSNQLTQIFIEENLMDFLYRQFKIYKFTDDLQNEYLQGILTLVRNLTTSLNKQFNLYLEDIGFLSFVMKKILEEGGGKSRGNNINKKQIQLLKLRTNIIKTLDDRNQKLLNDTLDQLYDEKIYYSRNIKQYLQLLNAIFNIVNEQDPSQLQSKKKLFYSRSIDAMILIRQYFSEQLNQDEILLLFKLLRNLYLYYMEQITYLKIYLIPENVLIQNLDSQNEKIAKAVLKIVSVQDFITNIQLIFNPKTFCHKNELLEAIIKSSLNYISDSKTQSSSIRSLLFITELTDNRKPVEYCLKQKILEKLEEVLLSDNLSVKNIIRIIHLFQNFIQYILKKDDDPWILKILQSRGFLKTIQQFQFHPQKQLQEQSIRIYEKYSKVCVQGEKN